MKPSTPPPPPATQPPSPATPSAGRLRWWWILPAGLAVALYLMGSTHLLRGTAVMGATLVLAAVVRLILPSEAAGALAVRSKWLDILLLVVAAVAVVVAGFTLNLLPLQ